MTQGLVMADEEEMVRVRGCVWNETTHVLSAQAVSPSTAGGGSLMEPFTSGPGGWTSERRCGQAGSS